LPRFSLNFTGGDVDAKKWQNYASPGGLIFSALNDAENDELIWLRVNRVSGIIPKVIFVNGTVAINTLSVGGATALCRNATNEISTCSSSARYKTNINPFNQGLSLIKQLRPVSFKWKADNTEDMGLVAEEVNAVEPLLTTVNEKGEVEGVKYDRVGVVLVNAVNEQQDQIEALQIQIKQQQSEIIALKTLVCAQNSGSTICVASEKKP
jgi:Chaperone of endosialidase